MIERFSFRCMILGAHFSVMCALLIFCCPGAGSAGQLYTFVDERGGLHYSNVPNDPRYGLVGRPRYAANLVEYESIISEAARYNGLDPALISAIIHIESGGVPDARSSKGALGLMQLMPGTASNLAVSDPLDPAANIRGGTRYLCQLIDRFKGNLVLALAAYNAGPRKVEKYRGIPPYPETRKYVRNVLKQWEKYRSR